MSLWKIAWRSIQQRGLASALTSFSMALGVMLVVAVLVIHGVVKESFRNSTSLGYNMIVGAKGGDLQLVLNTVYYLSRPVENIPYSYYKEFLPADKRGDGRNGQFAGYIKGAIPCCLGDYYRDFRVVGTTPEMFDLEYGNGRKYTFAAGKNFKTENFFDSVIGSTVARKTGLKVGDRINITHGAEDGHIHEEDAFRIAGILNPSGTPNDRAVFVNIEGFFLLENHAKPMGPQDAQKTISEQIEQAGKEMAEQIPIKLPEQVHPGGTAQPPTVPSTPHDHSAHDHADHDHAKDKPANAHDHEHEKPSATAEHDHEHASGIHEHDHPAPADPQNGQVAAHDHDHPVHDHDHHNHEGHDHKPAHRDPLPEEQREVTTILVRNEPLYTPELRNMINEGQVARAVLPVLEISNLFQSIVDPLLILLVVLTVMIVIVSGISIMVSIYNSMSERKHEIAVMRALGASRATVMLVVLFESILLALGGGLIGWLLGHVLIGGMSPWIADQTGVPIGFLQFVPKYELILIPGLIALASLAGYLPALAAYRTDVAKALTANP